MWGCRGMDGPWGAVEWRGHVGGSGGRQWEWSGGGAKGSV